jgi:Mg2+ and Co2+ transporter CorA
MTTEQAVKMIKEMLFKKTKVKFAEATLVDGTKITNNLEDDFELDQTLYVVAEDGTLVMAPEGSHTLESGVVIVLDEASVITEIRSEETEETTDEEMEEVVVDVPEETSDVITAEVVEAIVEAISPVIEEIKELQEELKAFKKDYKKFKSSEAIAPIKTKPQTYSQSFTDYRIDMLKKLKK